jgi:hypothetical protein
MENHLHECLYDVIRSNLQPAEKLAMLNRYKAKLVRHSTTKSRRSLLDLTHKDLFEGETPTIYQVLRTKRRQEARNISHIKDDTGVTHTTQRAIADTFLIAPRNTYRPIGTDEAAIEAIQSAVAPVPAAIYKETLEQPIVTTELEAALRAGQKLKAAGIDGLPLEFNTANWETIRDDLTSTINRMFSDKLIIPQQKLGIMISLPKSTNPTTTNDYRSITLLTTEYKLLARILARRLKQTVGEQLQHTQYCGVTGNNH